MRLAFLPLLLALLACPKAPPATVDAGCQRTGQGKPGQVVFGGARPVTLQVPDDYDPACPAPLLLVLHGYGASGELEANYLGLTALVEGRGVLLAAPDGTLDNRGSRFWNAGISACCNFSNLPVDDVAYLGGLLDEIRGVYAVDPARVFVVGHSNGGFMAHRLACERAADIAGFVSLAGGVSQEPIACRPSVPVSALQVHGDQDTIVLYDGGTNILNLGGGAYASAPDAVARWASHDGCQPTTSAGARLDLELALPGDDTAVTSFDGCPAGVAATLWTIEGGGHSPQFSGRFAAPVWRWLDTHARR